MPGRVVEELHLGAGLLPDLLFLLAGLVGRIEGVLFGVVALHRRGDAGELIRNPLPHPIERHRGTDLVALLGGQQQHEAAAHAEAHRADLAGGDGGMVEQEVDRPGQVLGRLLGGQFRHQPAGLVRVVGGLAAEQVRRQRHEAFLREPVGDVDDVVGKPPPLLDDDHPRASSGLRQRQVAVRLAAVAGERGVLGGVVAGHVVLLRHGCAVLSGVAAGEPYSCDGNCRRTHPATAARDGVVTLPRRSVRHRRCPTGRAPA
jgi:hypothetical protein